MDLEQIRIIISISDTLSFTKTAEELGYSLATVSRQVSKIENAFGTKLFIRNRKSTVVPTDVLLHILPSLKDIEYRINEINRKIIALNDKTEIHIGIPFSVDPFIEFRIIEAFRIRFPEKQLFVHKSDNQRIIQLLSNKDIDICFYTRFGKVEDELQDSFSKALKDYGCKALFTDKGIINVSKYSILACKESLSLEELQLYPDTCFIFTPLESIPGLTIFKDECDRYGIRNITTNYSTQYYTDLSLIFEDIKNNNQNYARLTSSFIKYDSDIGQIPYNDPEGNCFITYIIFNPDSNKENDSFIDLITDIIPEIMSELKYNLKCEI
ncbi:MAG: LysR family transcriptional regulator [Firmicutes bacterium]|nr:LysR family transcriptional regulator [Bacillota bacterium]